MKKNTKEQNNHLTRDEIERLLIEYLAASKVSQETILPIVLMLGKNSKAMIELMLYIKNNNPTEEKIFEIAAKIRKGMERHGELED